MGFKALYGMGVPAWPTLSGGELCWAVYNLMYISNSSYNLISDQNINRKQNHKAGGMFLFVKAMHQSGSVKTAAILSEFPKGLSEIYFFLNLILHLLCFVPEDVCCQTHALPRSDGMNEVWLPGKGRLSVVKDRLCVLPARALKW